MRTNRNGHSAYAAHDVCSTLPASMVGACRFCGERNANEAQTCPTIKPRVAKREAAERAASGGAQ
jgi:hypothetical protein